MCRDGVDRTPSMSRKDADQSRSIAPRSWFAWTEKDNATIRELLAQGFPVSQIAPLVGRTRTAVNQQIQKWKVK